MDVDDVDDDDFALANFTTARGDLEVALLLPVVLNDRVPLPIRLLSRVKASTPIDTCDAVSASAPSLIVDGSHDVLISAAESRRAATLHIGLDGYELQIMYYVVAANGAMRPWTTLYCC